MISTMTDAAYEQAQGGPTAAILAGVFARQKAFAEHAFEQLDDAQFFAVVAPGLNSPAVICRHIAGNLRSRFTDFFESDGEKPWRDRDAELAPYPESMDDDERARERLDLMEQWEQSWRILLDLLEGMNESDLTRIVRIRTVKHAALAALLRQLDHYAFHIGQLNVIARQLVGSDRWRWFTLAPGTSREFNRRMGLPDRS